MKKKNRERERQYEREKFWNRLENLASRSPSYEIMKMKQEMDFNSLNNSPDSQDEDISLDKLEQEAQEVRKSKNCQFSLTFFSFLSLFF